MKTREKKERSNSGTDENEHGRKKRNVGRKVKDSEVKARDEDIGDLFDSEVKEKERMIPDNRYRSLKRKLFKEIDPFWDIGVRLLEDGTKDCWK